MVGPEFPGEGAIYNSKIAGSGRVGSTAVEAYNYLSMETGNGKSDDAKKEENLGGPEYTGEGAI